ncbi:uncharacterized protein JN550_013137 [Neoarthrinium moseri]|uniref:uncharacterized protein n=1 Tax=Neoarthrinium moseri TaxID=1658444 RepID=UPI001FDCCC1A|nr:uncharacterized protein JN550_013137 [Neoarthrinium moseri]KAI1857568.1 hypothetical protein JN550_013137 [Neoarthrinium moseri]
MAQSHLDKREPYLCALPLEIRLMIFEHAVRLDNVVVPQQVVKGSNKFTWGTREQVPVHYHPGNNAWAYIPPAGERLSVVSLSLTCKQFYEELRDTPVFYRVNLFCFPDLEELIRYLAAITPERRKAIRNIVVEGFKFPLLVNDERIYLARQTPYMSRLERDGRHALALLSHCDDLRTLTFLITLHHALESGVVDELKILHEWFKSFISQAPATKPSIHALPRLDVMSKSSKGYRIGKDWFLGRGTGDWNNEPMVWAAISDFESARASLRTSAMTPVPDRLLRSAIESAKLDLNGDERACGFSPVVRQKKLDSTMDYRLGTFKSSPLPKYNQQGLLLWNVGAIESITGATDSNFTCKVRWATTGDEEPKAREEARNLMTRDGLDLFRCYYDSTLLAMRASAAWSNLEVPSALVQAALDEIDAMPPPNDIKALGEHVLTSQALQARWRRLQRDYDRTRDRLLRRHSRALKQEGRGSKRKGAAAEGAEAEGQPRKRARRAKAAA